mgnify:FL=1|jgi:hypothetical protein
MLQEINLLGIRKQTILCHFEKICDLAVMKEITETDEKNIDKGLRFNTGTQFIERDKIILYGEIDFNNKNDVKLIKNKNLMFPKIVSNIVYSTFDYKSGIATSINNVYKMTIEVDPVKWFMYNYCLIGKPKRVIVYKTTKSYLWQ